jgi:DNA polymerase III subunit epsilon
VNSQMQTSLFASGLMSDSQPSVNAQEILNQPLRTIEFVVLDLETTGFNPKKNSITEITAIRYINGIEQAMYSTLVNPTERIPSEVEALTGISNEMVADAPPLLMAMNGLFEFMGSQPVIVGHNVGFDLGFLIAKSEECGFHTLQSRLNSHLAVCTCQLARKVMPGLPSYEGILVATQCGYHNPNPHRAEADVRMSAAILFALITKSLQSAQPLHTLQDIIHIQGEIQVRG